MLMPDELASRVCEFADLRAPGRASHVDDGAKERIPAPRDRVDLYLIEQDKGYARLAGGSERICFEKELELEVTGMQGRRTAQQRAHPAGAILQKRLNAIAPGPLLQAVERVLHRNAAAVQQRECRLQFSREQTELGFWCDVREPLRRLDGVMDSPHCHHAEHLRDQAGAAHLLHVARFQDLTERDCPAWYVECRQQAGPRAEIGAAARPGIGYDPACDGEGLSLRKGGRPAIASYRRTPSE